MCTDLRMKSDTSATIEYAARSESWICTLPLLTNIVLDPFLQANGGDIKIRGLAVRDESGRLKRVLSSAMRVFLTWEWKVFCFKVKNLSDEQKAAIERATSASDIDVQDGNTSKNLMFEQYVFPGKKMSLPCTRPTVWAGRSGLD